MTWNSTCPKDSVSTAAEEVCCDIKINQIKSNQNISLSTSPHAICPHLLINFWKFLGKTLNLDIVFSLILLLLCGILYFHFLGVLLTLTYLRNDLKPIFKSLELHRWPNLCQTLFVSFLPCYLNIFVGFNLYLLIL